MTAPTRERVIQWAREAGLIKQREVFGETDDLERLAALAYAAGQAAEREACELAVDSSSLPATQQEMYVKKLAMSAIRARGES